MSGAAGLVVAPEARIYDHGFRHPLRPQRVLLTWELIAAYGIDLDPGVVRLGAEPADDETLMLVHTPEFIEATRDAGHGIDGPWGRFGYGVVDNPIFDDMHEAGALVAGASLAAARAVLSGEVAHAFNAAGGLHHAMPDRASGFCVYDDPAVAIAWLLTQGVERIAYVDVDVHHGDGVERIFWDDPRVLTVSLHESGRALFPGTGWPGDTGGPNAQGSAVNVALPPGTGDSAWLRALHATALPIVRAFKPEVMVTQHGCDTHAQDPLAHLAMSVDAQRAAAEALHRLAHDVCEGRWVALGGGGYELVDVVPRAWTHLTGIASHRPIPLTAPVPEGWLEHV
ncbi:MAG TPA: acetoin utilization protein AcuC, partial [Actinomycetota bacterium]|nr:acetoin utilization protein AcuC [Actinomycetota bacterium]